MRIRIVEIAVNSVIFAIYQIVTISEIGCETGNPKRQIAASRLEIVPREQLVERPAPVVMPPHGRPWQHAKARQARHTAERQAARQVVQSDTADTGYGSALQHPFMRRHNRGDSFRVSHRHDIQGSIQA